MNPDVDGIPAQQAHQAPAAEDLDVKKILLMQDKMIKEQAAQIADLSKQIGALSAARTAAVPAAEVVEKSPQDAAFEAMLREYGLVKADKEA